jgi:ribonuclease HI
VLARRCSISARVSSEIGMNAPRKIPATTNIVAEHLAIQLAMELAKEHGVTELVIYNDSRTPVNHVNGNYKVKQAHLVPIVDKTWEMGSELLSFEIRWTSRENTKEADALCRAVDKPRVHRVQAAEHPRLPTHEHLEGIDPIELVIDEPRGELRRVISWLRPPQMRHGQLRDIDFELRELGPA